MRRPCAHLLLACLLAAALAGPARSQYGPTPSFSRTPGSSRPAAGPETGAPARPPATPARDLDAPRVPQRETPTVATRQTAFAIPFQVNQSAGQSQPQEVQLYVSGDGGRNWFLYTRENPAAGKFRFRAGTDGEYWFCIRTKDAAGRIRPSSPYAAELKVLVDTAAPQVTLDVVLGRAQQVIARWSIDEPHLRPDTFRLAYRGRGQQQWQTMAVRLPRPAVAGRPITDEVSWIAPDGISAIQVRAEVADRAGNRTVVNRTLQLDSAPPEKPAPRTASDLDDPPREEPGVTRRDPSRPDPSQPDPGARTWPSDRVTRRPLDDQRPRSDNYYDRDPDINRRGRKPEPSDSRVRNVGRPAPVRSPARPQPGLKLPEDAPVRITRKQQLKLSYDLEAIDPRDIDAVQLYVTTDDGRTWTDGGVDLDKQSPFVARVDGEGLYGFRLVIKSKVGPSGRPPHRGETPDLWVLVDRTRPEVEVTSAKFGTGDRLGQLDIFWVAADVKLTRRPITLLYSSSPGGPWKLIAQQLPNSGRYSWQPRQELPPQIYLRLEARDQAGNVGVFELQRPLATSGLAPRARIRGLEER